MIFYETATGRVTGYVTCPANQEQYQEVEIGEDTLVGEVVNPDTQYVVSGALTDRPTFSTSVDTSTIIANNGDTATFTGIPEGATVFVDGIEYSTANSSGATTVSLSQVGAHTITVEKFPYVVESFSLEGIAIVDTTAADLTAATAALTLRIEALESIVASCLLVQT